MGAGAARPAPSPDTAYVLGLAAAFAASRAAVYALGVRFSTAQLQMALQLVDPELLRHRLVESLWYLHAQPPLYNLGIGLVLKLFPGSYGGVFFALQLALGVVALLCLYLLLARLGLPRPAAAAVALVASTSAEAILYENWFFYDYPLLALMCAVALATHWFASRPTTARGLVLFGLAATIVLTRSIYQGVWLLLIAGLLVLFRAAPWRLVAATAAVPLLLVCLVYAKNLAVFGTPVTSSWLGVNVARMTVFILPDGERRRLVREGKLSRVSLVPTFSQVADYRSAIGPTKRWNVPVLDRERKSVPRWVNANNAAYLEVSRRYLGDSLWVMRHRPGAYARGIKLAVERYFWPPDYTGPLGADKQKLARWEGLWFALQGSTSRANRVGFLVLAGYLAAALYGLRIALRGLRERPAGPATVTLAFIWLNLVYTTLVATTTDLGENYRSRLPIDPIVAVLLAVAAHRAWTALRERRAERVGVARMPAT